MGRGGRGARRCDRRRVAHAAVRDARARRERDGHAGRHADARAERPPQPGRAGVRARRITSKRVLLQHLRARSRARASSSAPRWRSVDNGPEGVRAVLREHEHGGERGSSTLAISSRRTARTAPCGARSASPCAAPTTSPRSSRRSSARRCGTSLGEYRHGIYSVTHPEAPGLFLPAGRDDRWLYGVYWNPEVEQAADFDEARLTDLIRLGAGVPDLEPRSSGSAPSRSPRRSPTTSGRRARS